MWALVWCPKVVLTTEYRIWVFGKIIPWVLMGEGKIFLSTHYEIVFQIDSFLQIFTSSKKRAMDTAISFATELYYHTKSTLEANHIEVRDDLLQVRTMNSCRIVHLQNYTFPKLCICKIVLLCQLYTLTECVQRELHKMRLCECDFLHSCHELSIHEERESKARAYIREQE